MKSELSGQDLSSLIIMRRTHKYGLFVDWNPMETPTGSENFMTKTSLDSNLLRNSFWG